MPLLGSARFHQDVGVTDSFPPYAPLLPPPAPCTIPLLPQGEGAGDGGLPEPPLPSQGEREPLHWAHRRAPLRIVFSRVVGEGVRVWGGMGGKQRGY
jgi:hypothetical protein